MRDRIKAAAEANNRSMNAEIVATLEKKYPAPLALDMNTATSHDIMTYMRKGPGTLRSRVKAVNEAFYAFAGDKISASRFAGPLVQTLRSTDGYEPPDEMAVSLNISLFEDIFPDRE